MSPKLDSLFFGLLLLLTACGSQKSAVTSSPITLDFLNFTADKAKLEAFKSIKHDNKFQVKVENINKSLWTILDSTKQENFNTAMPDIFKGIKLPAFLNLDLPAPAMENSAAAPDSVVLSLDDLKALFNIIATAREEVDKAVELNNILKGYYADCGSTYAAISSSLASETHALFPGIATARALQPAQLSAHLKKQVTESRAALKKLKENVPLYIEQQYSSISAEMAGDIWSFKNLPPDKVKEKEKYQVQGRKSQMKESEIEQTKRHIESVNTALKSGEAIVSEIETFFTDNKIGELINNYNLINESNFTYYTDELTVKNDQVILNLQFVPLKPLACNLPSKQRVKVELKTYGGLKVDFSTGFFVMGGNDDFLGRELYYKSVGADNSTIESKDGGKRALLGIGGLMHIYWRSGYKVNWAISPGISTTTGFDAANFHLGASLLSSGKNRIAVTAGLTLKESKIVDRRFELGTPYAKSTLPEAPPTIKVFPKAGWFLSLTYNWSREK